ncbi:hypothetical protein SAMN02745163_01284 [Clostridium cavendishii DSM 21758]|uniref:Trypsin-like peptidase domain-containing protein n=1 Tax=Clostridium cavendishii DSM 21758 TaxID=1121302 RepID=A0A1M6GGM9_9CLOT|nr:trypsin-like peptidase domain-containing protein [Clostridium cavendishii]SHJ09115.1 hypothetical protein SAMN02745163_01284 [Clostridium cavendishii DSM 21758]
MRLMKKCIVVISSLVILVSLVACKSSKAAISKDVKDNTNVQEPVIANNCVLRACFYVDDIKLNAGTSFSVEVEGQENPIVLTALHLFGPNGGLEKDIVSSELPNHVKGAVFSDAFTSKACGSATKTILIPEAKPSPNVSKDIAAFVSDKNSGLSPLKINDMLPEVGETVWLAASVYGGAPEDKKLHKAVVVESTDSKLAFEYENDKLELKATSGAPVLNSAGKVVGLNIGSMKNKGKVIGVANPCVSFNKLLKDALK